MSPLATLAYKVVCICMAVIPMAGFGAPLWASWGAGAIIWVLVSTTIEVRP